MMIDRRTFIGSTAATALAVGLAGCGGEGSGATGSTSAAQPTLARAPPPPPPAPLEPPVLPPRQPGSGIWQLEGDSYMITQQAWNIAAGLGESAYYTAVGGSTLQQVHDRILGRADLRANPLLIWDGSANGHVVGASWMDLALLGDIVAFKGEFRNWLLIPSVPIFDGTGTAPGGAAIVRDLRDYTDAAVKMFGAEHVFDSVPTLRGLTTGSAEDAADIAAGFLPRSVLVDGVHLTEAAKLAVATALTIQGGPMATARLL